jgi:hypothetical protein
MKGSQIRLLVLVTVLGVVIGAYAYDYLVAAPGSEKAFEDLEALALSRESQATESGGLVHSADVQKVVGFAPTFTQKETNYTVEWYCWWGPIPGLSTWKRYLTVVYVGAEPRYYSTHHKNEPPPEEFLPKMEIFQGPTPTPVAPPKALGLTTEPDPERAASKKADEGAESGGRDQANEEAAKAAGEGRPK